MNQKLIATTIAFSMLLFAAPTAVAAGTVGASGQCYDDNGDGGEGHVGVSQDGAETHGLTDVSQDDPTPSTADAVVALANTNGNPSEGDACTDADDDSDDQDGTAGADYLEVHVGDNQACYDGSVQTDNSCDRSQGDN